MAESFDKYQEVNPEIIREISDESLRYFWDSSRELVTDRPYPPNDTLYHYTSIDAAINIIENNELWLTNIYFMNDSNEMICAQNMLDYVSNQDGYKSNHPEKYSLARKILDNSIKSSNFNHFVMSFCTSGDQLSQWRGYGAGVAIGFKASKLDTCFPAAKLRKVIYSPSEQATIIDNLLHSTSNYAKSRSIKNKEENDYIFDYTKSMFDLIAAKMKNELFREENEWRLVNATPIHEKIIDRVNFRSKGKVVIPFIKIKPDSRHLPITSITVSPTSPLQNVPSLQMMCIKNGLNLTVERSMIPFVD